ncbi:hypothetical protein HRI_002693600 [Hibiscus trionum]|uniref:Uncharacterized protein n=1 Tax=Hibiscus trionum TaxID=183268 RepID=A0A9W7M6W0_HIBTR|nr:hypothetical protein HRI_002693600 [Hibiscus trionum]
MELDHGNGNSKHSRTDIKESNTQLGQHQGLVVRNQSRNNLELDGEAGSSELSSEVSGSFMHLTKYDVETRSSNQSDTYSEVINGVAGIESNHFENNLEVVKVRGNNHDFEIQSDSSKQSEVIQEKEKDILDSAGKQSLTSSSLYSSASSTDDQFQVDLKLSKTRSGPKPEENTMQSLQDKHHVSGNSSYKFEERQNGDASLKLTSQVSSVTHETTSMQSPPVQVMGRVEDADSYKIPSAVFARSKEDWSNPSTESLFSIQLENCSFSRDHILSSTSKEYFKSVDLSPPPAVPVGDTDKKGVEPDKSEATSVSDDALKDKKSPSVDDKHICWNSAKITHTSVDSVDNAQAISFPVRNMQKQRNCCNCWWEICYSWKCSFLTDAKSAASQEKAQQQQQKEDPVASSEPSKAARRNCFPCFSSCRWHWCGSCNCCRRNSCSRTL